MKPLSADRSSGVEWGDQDHDDEQARSERWLVSYADLVTTLMVFFLALYILQVSRDNALRMKDFAARSAVAAAAASASTAATAQAPVVAKQPTQAKAQLLARLAPLVALKEITATQTPQGVEIGINTHVLFGSAEARLLPDAVASLEGVARALEAASSGNILVVGHTDNAPISNSRFASNWELSAARAGAVVRYLVEHGIDPHRLAAIGRADNDPVVLGDDPAARAVNRRVTIVVDYSGE
ncbi:OmpA/MotB family protein [Burkholderia guangdongensis]|uniref:OmpA/MotB family protein n=1 Tax=Burkholderia guangdongensis TaxID=1792500 RepID=UPI0015CAF767|nr:OmpA family protein [Burkholderia guangdongensis]